MYHTHDGSSFLTILVEVRHGLGYGLVLHTTGCWVGQVMSKYGLAATMVGGQDHVPNDLIFCVPPTLGLQMYVLTAASWVGWSRLLVVRDGACHSCFSRTPW